MNIKAKTPAHDLGSVAKRVLNADLHKEHQTSDWSQRPLTEEQIEYASADTEILFPLHKELMLKAKAKNLKDVIDLEHAALPAIVWMSTAGVTFNSEGWAKELKSLSEDKERAKWDLIETYSKLLGGSAASEVNWNSPLQIKCAFKGVGISLKDTKEATLKNVTHPLAKKLLQYKKLSKVISTYGEKLLDSVHNSRLYPNWKQIGAATGRMSCSSPNLQNFPPRVRKYVVAPEGKILIKADYSQIELRIAAVVSQDNEMLDAFKNGVDIHEKTARSLTGQATINKEARKLSKAVNFGLLYGQGANGLMNYAKNAYDIEMTLADAEMYRKTFFKTYLGVARWHYNVKEAFGSGSRNAVTLTGRTRENMKSFNELLNHPIQGSSADGLKASLTLLWKRRAECPSAFPVLVVHDEIVVECDIEDEGTVTAWLKKAMIDGMEQVLQIGHSTSIVPVVVDVEPCRSWGDLS